MALQKSKKNKSAKEARRTILGETGALDRWREKLKKEIRE